MSLVSILASFFIILICAIFTGIFYDAIWTPTIKKDYDKIAQLAGLRPGIIFYDLGSGSANILFYFSKKYDIDCVGIEISPFWYFYSKIKSLFYKKVKIKYGNFHKHDISEADVVYAFLLPKAYHKLKNKIDKELKKRGKLILSCCPLEYKKTNNIAKKENLMSYCLFIKNNKNHLILSGSFI